MGFFGFERKKGRIYLDYAAATPVQEHVLTEMAPYFGVHFGNPSAIHKEGVHARDAVEHARERVARTLGIRTRGVVFTGSGTEANNLAIYGTVRALKKEGQSLTSVRIISTQIEHPSVLEPLKDLNARGVDVVFAPVDPDGRIDEQAFGKLLTAETVLVTVAYANSEVGTLQDVKHLTRIVKKFNTENGTSIAVHLDAAQAPLWLPCRMSELGVDLLSLDAGKCYGPKGVGVLARRGDTSLRGIILGGGQEFDLRAGTENTSLIVGCAAALERAQTGWESRSVAVCALRNQMIEGLLSEIEGSILNGSRDLRIANNVNISIPGIDSEFAVVSLDSKGIAASTKSACSLPARHTQTGGAKGGGSDVVRAMTGDTLRARSTIRFSLGEETTERDIRITIKILKEHILKVRSRK